MKKFFAALLVFCLLAAAVPYAQAVSAQVNGATVSGATLYNGTTYVPLRALSQKLRPDASVSWEG
ncbi:MAG: copper amine oxidase, partial [Bacillota bacterium]